MMRQSNVDLRDRELNGRARAAVVNCPDRKLIMTLIDIVAGSYAFTARLEEETAPRTCAAFGSLLPWMTELLHVRWSGEACWIPMGDRHFALPSENATSTPAPGCFLLHPGGVSETEILIGYGEVRFASKFGPLVGNRFMTIIEGAEHLSELGKTTLWKGVQSIRFSAKS